MNDDDRALCLATAALLRASSVLAWWSLALSFMAGLVLALTGRSLPSPAWAACAAVALLGLPERYLALRMQLEAALFQGLAERALDALSDRDRALGRLGLRHRAEALNTLADRVSGARQLVQRHGITVIAQTAIFAMALALQDWR